MALEEKLKEFQGKIKQKPLTSVIIFIAVLLLLLIVIPYLDVNYRGINNATVEATLENQSRATFAQILGGAAIGIGLYYTWRRINIAEDSLKVTQESLKVAQDNLKVTQENLEATQKVSQDNLKVAQEGQITERFTRAVDQLGAIDKDGNPAIEIRLGGIYALERIANESQKDHWPIMEILTAYVRKNSSVENHLKEKVWIIEPISMDIQAKESTQKEIEKCNKISLDIDAVLNVLGKHEHVDENGDYMGLYLRGVYLKSITLTSAHFEGANFADACLKDATLLDIHFEKAFLAGTNFERAALINAHLEGAYLSEANLSNAILSIANLSNANLSYANFREAKNLSGDQLSKVKTLYKAELDPELENELRAKGFGKLIDDEPER